MTSYPVHLVTADDHHITTRGDRARGKSAQVWAIGVIVERTPQEIAVAMSGARFRGTSIEDDDDTDVFVLRRPAKVRRIAEVEL